LHLGVSVLHAFYRWADRLAEPGALQFHGLPSIVSFVSTFSLGVAAATAKALLARLTVEITTLNAALDGAQAVHQPPAADGAGLVDVWLGDRLVECAPIFGALVHNAPVSAL